MMMFDGKTPARAADSFRGWWSSAAADMAGGDPMDPATERKAHDIYNDAAVLKDFMGDNLCGHKWRKEILEELAKASHPAMSEAAKAVLEGT